MKTKLLLPIICACSLFKMQAQEWGYGFIDESIYMRNIWTQGLDTVYIVGNNGLIARSTDQGETWEKQYFPNKVALNDMMFVDYHTGFAVGEQGTILKTADAGETWKQIILDVTLHINAIAATGSDNIWAVGDNSLVLHSTDAGETWEQVDILPENDRQLLDIAFRGNLGYFTGIYGTVYKTDDSGITWNKQNVMEQLNIFYTFSMHYINIMENKTYLMGGSYLCSTEDQTNWESVDLFSEANPFFLNDSVGYFSAVGGAAVGGIHGLNIAKTSNDGKDWEFMTLLYNYSTKQDCGRLPPKIRMVNDTLGYAIFSHVLLKTPAPPYNYVTVNKINGDLQLYISQISENELVLKSESNPIKSIEVFDILGNNLIHKKWKNFVQETSLNVSDLHRSVYLIKVIFQDNTISINKYLIR